MAHKKVLVLGDEAYKSMFRYKGFTALDKKEVPLNSIPSMDLICFTGGVDIDPALYGEAKNHKTGYPSKIRDTNETAVFDMAKRYKVPMVGICRGAQLLCALNGHKLYQHVNHHTEHHLMKTYDGREMMVTSSHHQMMKLGDGNKARILGWSDNRSDVYEGSHGPEEAPHKDLEVVAFPETKSLCHQPHPEWMDPNAPYFRFFFNSVKHLMAGNL